MLSVGEFSNRCVRHQRDEVLGAVAKLKPNERAPAALFFNKYASFNTLFEAINVADDPDLRAAAVEALKCAHDDIEGLRVEGAEAFIEEQRLDGHVHRPEVGECERECEGDDECLTAREGG